MTVPTTQDDKAEKKAEREEIMANLPAKVKTDLALRAIQRNVNEAIAKKNWGTALDAPTIRAVADYCIRYNLDPVEDIDILGGRPYRKAIHYIKRLGDLTEAGHVEWHNHEHVEADPRLDEMAKDARDPEAQEWALKEMHRRLRLRITHAIPDAAKGAVVYHVKMKQLTEVISAANWCGGGTRKDDPVGEGRPQLTAETRAARRCIRFVIPHLKGEVGQEQATQEAEWEVIERKVGDALADDARLEKEQDRALTVGAVRVDSSEVAGVPVAEGEKDFE
jgi:hypothetical protein